MERFNQKRSLSRESDYYGSAVKFSGAFDQKSGTNLVLTKKATGKGNEQVEKVASDSSSFSSDPVEKDCSLVELRQNSWKQASGTAIKKLIAEEMSKETGARRHPQSVIARLMGLDAVPPQQPVNNKEQKRFSENYLRRTTSIGFQKKRSSSESRSFWKNSKEHQEFKDVFEVLETQKIEKNSNSSIHVKTQNSEPGEVEMSFIRQKFKDAKRFSTDEQLQHSKEFNDTLEVLDYNTDLLLKFLQEPDPLFTKHLHNLQSHSVSSQSGHISVIKSSKATKYENRDMSWSSAKKDELGYEIHSRQKCDNGLVRRSLVKQVNNSHALSEPRLDGMNETCNLPTRIVVLKPNLGRTQDTARSAVSPSSSGGLQSGYMKNIEYQYSGEREVFREVRERENSSSYGDFLRQSSRDPRETAKEITRQMRHTLNKRNIKVSNSGFKGYAGDDSSYIASGNNYTNDSEVPPTSGHLIDWSNRYSPSTSSSTESSVSREGKKRMSERWKRTHIFQEVGLVRKGNTLGEMLAMPDNEPRLRTVGSMADHGSGDRLARINGVTKWGSPLGISSKDGWKDGCARNLPRSRSLPASSTAFGIPEISFRWREFSNNRSLVSKEAINQDLSRSSKGNSNHREVPFHRKLSSRSRRSKSSSCIDENNHTLPVPHFNLLDLRDHLEEKDPSEQETIAPESLPDEHADAGMVPDKVARAVTEDLASALEATLEQQTEPRACVMLMKVGDSSTNNQDDSIPEETSAEAAEEGLFGSHCPVSEPESPSSSKEADQQPSPLSVLEPPFVDEISSGSECFERVSADLHGLRMQLELLKLESSDGFTEDPGMIVSSDEENGEGSVVSPEKEGGFIGMFKEEQSRDFSYVVDVLVDSGFHGSSREMVPVSYYSSELMVHPTVFENLEKKYCHQITWSRSERKLLWDRVNLGLMEVFRRCLDPHPWVKVTMTKVGSGYCEEPLEEELWKLLSSQEKIGKDDSLGKTMDKEMGWMELGDDIDAVGREIEISLIDELVAEVISM